MASSYRPKAVSFVAIVYKLRIESVGMPYMDLELGMETQGKERYRAGYGSWIAREGRSEAA